MSKPVELREKLAEQEHAQWAHWTKYMLEQLGLWKGDPGQRSDLARWRRQCNTSYADLTEMEKDSDRMWADKTLEVLREHMQ